MSADTRTLIAKIQSLSAERIAAVEDFVDIIRLCKRERGHRR